MKLIFEGAAIYGLTSSSRTRGIARLRIQGVNYPMIVQKLSMLDIHTCTYHMGR